MSIDIINGVASDPAWEDKGLEERNEALAKAFDADRDAKDLRSDEQKELDAVNTQSAEGFGIMLGQGGESAADFTPSGFVAQEAINSYSDTQRDVAVALNTSIYQKNNADPSVRGNYEEMSKAVSDYMDGEQTPEDARMMALRMSAESLKINKTAENNMALDDQAAEFVNSWSQADGHSSKVTSVIAAFGEMGQQVIADGLNVLDPDVRNGTEPEYQSEASDAREAAKAVKENMLTSLMEQNPDMMYSEAEATVDTRIADAKLDAGFHDGKWTVDSNGSLVTKSSFYLLDEATQRAELGTSGLSKHEIRKFMSTREAMGEEVMKGYREAALLLPDGDKYFKELGEGDLDTGIRRFINRGQLSAGGGKAIARIDDWIGGAASLVGAKETGEKYTKMAAARRLLANQQNGNSFWGDLMAVVPDLAVSYVGGSAAKILTRTGKMGKLATFAGMNDKLRVSVYGSAAASGGSVGLGVFGESRAGGKSYAQSLALAAEATAITAAVTTIGGTSGFEGLAAGSLGRNAAKVKLTGNSTWSEAMKLRWGQMNTAGKAVFGNSYKEFLEESTDEWLQSAIVSKQLYPDLTMKDHAEMAWHAGKVGAAIGGVVGVRPAIQQLSDFNKQFDAVRNEAKLSDIAKDRGIVEEVNTAVSDLVNSSSPLTAGALTYKVINDAKQQNDEREAKIEAETGKAGIAQRIITKLGDVAAGRTGESNIKDDVVGRQKARVEQSRDVAIKADEAYRDNPTPENQAKLSAANLNFDTQVEVSKKILGGLTAKNQTAGETSTSETVVEDEPGKAIPENQAVDEFNEVKPPPVNERKVEEQRQADEERAAADAAADAAAGKQAELLRPVSETAQDDEFGSDAGWTVDKYKTKEEAIEAAQAKREGLSSFDENLIGRTATKEKLNDAVRITQLPDGTYEVHSTFSPAIAGENTRIKAIKQSKESLPAPEANQESQSASVTPIAKPKRPYKMKQKPVVTPATPVVETVEEIETRLQTKLDNAEEITDFDRLDWIAAGNPLSKLPERTAKPQAVVEPAQETTLPNLKPTKIQQNIDNNAGVVLDKDTAKTAKLSDNEIYDSLNRANEFVRASRQDGVKQTPGLYNFNESTMKLEIAADSTYDGYGEQKYGARMPERAALEAGLDEFNKRNDVSKLNAKYEADVKYNKPIEQQEQSLKNLKRAIRANLRLAVTDPSNSDMLKNKMIPVRDDTGAKRSMMEIFDDKEAVSLAGQMEVKEDVAFLNNLGLSPNPGKSSRNSPRTNALMKFFNNRFTPDTAGTIRYQDKVTIKPNEDVLLDLLALRDALPTSDSNKASLLMGKYDESPEAKKIITALVNNGWMKFGPDGKTGLIDTIPKKSLGRYNSEYKGLDRKDIGQSLMLLNGKQNQDGTLEVDLTPPSYLTESQQEAYNKTRASNVNYTLSTRMARGMLDAVNNGTFPRRVADRIKAADPAAPLYSGTDFDVDKSGHPFIKRIGSTLTKSSRPELKSENGDSKPIPMPESGIANVSDVNMDWLKATKSFFDVVAKHASGTKMSPSLHPTITYAKPISEAIAAVQKMATNQINQYKRSADYKEGAPVPFATDDVKKAMVQQYSNVLFRVRDLNDMITETAKQVTRNSTLQQDSYVDYDILNEMESYGQTNIENISARQLVDVLDRQFSNEKLYTESLMSDGTGREGFENQEDVLKNDNIIALIREFGLNKSKSTQEQNKRMRSLMLAVLNDGDIDAARAFSGEYKTEESLDEALMDRLTQRVEEEAGDVNTDKRLILEQVMGDTDGSATQVAAGKSDKEGFEYIKSYVEQLPTNKVEVMKAKDGLAAFAPGLTGGRVTPTDILIQQIGGNLGDVSMIYYDGKGIDRKKAANGSLVLLDADNNITGILVDSSDTMFDDGIAKVADQILQQTLAKNIDTKLTAELDDFKSIIDEVLARPQNTEAYKVVKKQVGQTLSDLSNAEFVQKVMRDTRLQQVLGDLKLDNEASMAVSTDAELESLTTSYLDAAFYMAPTEQDANPVAEYEHSDLDATDISRTELSSFGQAKMEQAFEGLDLDPLVNYKNSDVLRQVVKAGLVALKPATSTTQLDLAEQYKAVKQQERLQAVDKGKISVLDFINKKNSMDRRFEQYEKSLDTPFRANNLNVKPDTDTAQRRKDATTLDEKWAAVTGEGNYITETPLADVDREAGQKVRDAYEKNIRPGLPEWAASLDLDDVYKEAALDHYVKRMAAQRSQLRKQRESGQKVNTPLTSYDLRDGTVGVAKLKKMMKESGSSLDLTNTTDDSVEFDDLLPKMQQKIEEQEVLVTTPDKVDNKNEPVVEPVVKPVLDTTLDVTENAAIPPIKMKPVSALSAPGATVSVVKAANKLQLDVRNKMYQSDPLYRNSVDTDPNDSVLQNYEGLIASMSQTYADPRTTAEAKAAAATVLEMAIKGRHQGVFIMGNKIMANSISEDAAKTMLGGVYSKFRKRVWNHRASVVDTVLSQDKTANDYGHDIFARVDLGLRGTDGRNGWKREVAQLKQLLQPLEAKMGKKKSTEAYVAAQLASISNDSSITPYNQVLRNIKQLKDGIAANQSFIDGLSQVRKRGKVAAEIRSQIAPAMKAIKKAESMLTEDGFSIQAFDAAMLDGMSTTQKMFIQNSREFFAKKLPALQLMNSMDNKKMGNFSNYLPWRGFDVDNPQGPDVGFNDLEPEQTLDSHSNYLGKRFAGEQMNGIDLNPLRAILAVANTTAYQTNTKFSNEHFANVFGDDSHDSQFKKAVKHYDKGAKQQEKLNLLNEVMAEEIRTTINNDLRATKHDNWFYRGTDLAAATGFRVSLSSVEQPFLQTLPVLGAYGARDPGKAANVSEVLTKLVATTPMKAASKLTGGEANTYADYVDTLLRYAAPELHAREVNGINEMKDVIDKVRLSDLEGIIDKVTFAPKSLYSIINTTHEWFLKASTGAPDSMLIRAIWAANYEHATGQKIDKDSVSNFNVTAAFNATRAAEGEMALSDGSTKSQLFQQAENGGVEFFRRSLIVFSNHLMSLAPNVSAAKAMLKSDDAAMKAEGKKRIADFVLQTVLFNGMKMKNLAFAVAYMTTRGIDDEDERYDAFMKRQEKLLGFAHNYAGFNERRPMDMSDYAWSMGVKSALELTGVATPWASIAAINGTASSMVKQVAKDVYGIRAPGTGDRYMKEIEGFVNMFGAPGFGLNAFLQLEAVHRTAQYDYEFNMDHLALMYLSFGGPREMRQRMMDKVRKNTGASEWNKSYGKKIDMPFYDHTPSNFKSHDAPLAPTDFKYQKPTAEEWAMAEFTPPKSYKLEKMDWLNREGASYIDGDSGVMKNGFLSYFYPRMMGVDTLESNDNSNATNSRLLDQAASLNISKQQAMNFGRKAAHDTYMTLKDQDVYVSHNSQKVHGGRRTYAHILIKKGDKFYNVGSLSLIKGYALPTGRSNTMDTKLNNYAKRNKRGFYADKAK